MGYLVERGLLKKSDKDFNYFPDYVETIVYMTHRDVVKGEEMYVSYGEKYWADKGEKILPNSMQFAQNIEDQLVRNKELENRLEYYDGQFEKMNKRLKNMAK